MKKQLITSLLLVSITFSTQCIESVLKNLQKNNINFVEFCFTDYKNNLKSILYPVGYFQDALVSGVSFDGSSIPGFSRITSSDMILKPDVHSIRLLPWTDGMAKTARVICDVFADEETPYAADPRNILREQINRAASYGYEFLVGPEIEFYVFKKDNTPIDNQTYCDGDATFDSTPLKATVLEMLRMLNCDPEKIHHEVGPGQYEVSLHYDSALAIADNIGVVKQFLQLFGTQNQWNVSFMPKPIYGQNGNGMHIHFSLFNVEENRNIFFDSADQHLLSAEGKSFIAGILNRIKEMALILNPTINSYKRLVPGFEAPRSICCGRKNRSALIRLPYVNSEAENAVRAEIRCPDPQCNPYLTFAALLKAGLEGIEQNAQLNTIVTENLYECSEDELISRGIDALPTSLEEAIIYFEQSQFMRELLGEKLFTTYLHAKKADVRLYNQSVTD